MMPFVFKRNYCNFSKKRPNKLKITLK